VKVTLRIRPVADAELQHAKQWYASISLRLARQFVASLKDAFDTMREYPEIGTLTHDSDSESVRQFRLKAFPYNIYYFVSRRETSNEVILYVIGFRHDSQRQVEWEQYLN
jgi:plasmid stabilization system protein ParE